MTGACTLLVPLPTDEYTNGVANDGSVPETSVEDNDGGSQPRDDGGPVTPGACDATFCESFDEGPLGGKWGTVQTAEGGQLSLVPSTQGPPNALRVHLAGNASGGTGRSAYLGKTFPFPKQARCSIDVSAGPGLSAGDDMEMLGLRLQNAAQYYSVHVKLGDDELHVRESITSDSTTSAKIPAPPWTGAWVHVELDVELGVKATVSALGQKQELALRPFSADSITLIVGESGDSDAWTYEVLLDNVACTFTP